MASNYAGFAVLIENSPGVFESVGAGVDITVTVEGGAAVAESPLTTDADGEIAAGSFAAVAVGTVVHFTSEIVDGKAATISQTTT